MAQKKLTQIAPDRAVKAVLRGAAQAFRDYFPGVNWSPPVPYKTAANSKTIVVRSKAKAGAREYIVESVCKPLKAQSKPRTPLNRPRTDMRDYEIGEPQVLKQEPLTADEVETIAQYVADAPALYGQDTEGLFAKLVEAMAQITAKPEKEDKE